MPDGIKLGAKVTDRITGFFGIATARTEYLYDNPSVFVEPQGGGWKYPGPLPAEGRWIKEERLLKQGKPAAAATPPPRTETTPKKEETCQ